jgi:hypothetical protein
MINKILNMIKNGKFLIKLRIKVIWNKNKIKMMHRCWGIKVKIIIKNIWDPINAILCYKKKQ